MPPITIIVEIEPRPGESRETSTRAWLERSPRIVGAVEPFLEAAIEAPSVYKKEHEKGSIKKYYLNRTRMLEQVHISLPEVISYTVSTRTDAKAAIEKLHLLAEQRGWVLSPTVVDEYGVATSGLNAFALQQVIERWLP